jgi:alpha-L-fucosidase 2
MDVHVPGGQGPFAAAVLVHGGGWEAGDRVTYITPMFAPLASADVAWFSIDYRLTPDVANEQQVRDVRQAVDHVREHAARYRVDPRRIVLVGESASGQIVAQLATEGIDVAGVVSFYGVYDLEVMAGDPASPRSLARRLFGLSTLDEEGRARIRRQSPLHQVHARMPPLLLVTGTKDGLWAQAQVFEQALARVGARHASIVLPDAPHGMEQWDSDPRWEGWDARVLQWMLEVTSAAAPRP